MSKTYMRTTVKVITDYICGECRKSYDTQKSPKEGGWILDFWYEKRDELNA